MVTILFWIVFGGLAGWVASLLNEDLEATQTIAYIALGIVGALVGGLLINLFNEAGSIHIGINNLVFPTLGAIIALYIATQARKQS